MHRLPALLEDKSHVIWDWNGTLLDDLDLCVEIGADVLERFGYPRVTRDTYLAQFRFPVVDYYKSVGVDLERTSFEEMSHHFMTTYQARVQHSKLFAGTREMLAGLVASGIRCSVLSATHEPDLQVHLEHHGLTSLFTHVCGLGDRRARSKVERGRQLLAQMQCAPAEVVMFGDTDHDAEVATALGIDVILLTGGHQSEERLAARGHRVFRRTAG
ncbi:HAD family hydrolase [Nannocystis punicea]|uniref:phosphoglycolate phosphatase n=1 Tax=Nannocystis punicea TaxID=2995304 RepID=A0ABY7GWU6_9BACT|nr:HAD hydrolase-like protein [Nannocystis poenicansa]WAS91431.1 HAD hydrolase-like protein [Nannocystis poenicansa]